MIIHLETEANKSAPADDPGFANVGILNGGCGVYLGLYGGKPWAITAAHVGYGTLHLTAGKFDMQPGTDYQLKSDENEPIDLLLFQLKSAPPLKRLTIGSDLPPDGDVLCISQGPSVKGPFTYAGVPGYFGERQGPRWAMQSFAFQIGYSPSGLTWPTQAVGYIFTLAKPGSCCGIPGDSGSAVFRKEKGQWTLSGIAGGTWKRDGQPDEVAIDRQNWMASQLAFYRQKILDHIGQPSDAPLSKYPTPTNFKIK